VLEGEKGKAGQKESTAPTVVGTGSKSREGSFWNRWQTLGLWHSSAMNWGGGDVASGKTGDIHLQKSGDGGVRRTPKVAVTRNDRPSKS